MSLYAAASKVATDTASTVHGSSAIYTVGAWLAVVVAVTTILGVAFRWIFLPFFVTPLAAWFEKRNLEPALAPIAEDVGEIKKLVTYHLGANGATPPLRDRVLTLETTVANVREDVRNLDVEKADKA